MKQLKNNNNDRELNIRRNSNIHSATESKNPTHRTNNLPTTNATAVVEDYKKRNCSPHPIKEIRINNNNGNNKMSTIQENSTSCDHRKDYSKVNTTMQSNKP